MENKELTKEKLMGKWLCVGSSGTEFLFQKNPYRVFTGYDLYGNSTGGWVENDDDTELSQKLPKGTIEKLIGRKLTWKDEPVQIGNDDVKKTIHDAPCEPLVLCFNIDPHLLDTDERIEVLSDMTDEELYKEACEGVEIGLADIYALGDFLGDLTNGELKDKYYYYRYVMVSRVESDKWLK